MKSIENEGEIKFSALLDQIEKSVRQELYYIAIMASLTVPDIGGAICSCDGLANQSKYEKWFDNYAAPKFQTAGENRLNGKECYFLRCSMLHQGKMLHRAIKRYSDIFICEFPQTRTNVNPVLVTKNRILLIEPRAFCNNMISAAYDWLEVIYNDGYFIANSKDLMSIFSLSFTSFTK